MGSSCKAGAAGNVSMSKGSIQGQETGGSHAAKVHSEGAFSPHRVTMTRSHICSRLPAFPAAALSCCSCNRRSQAAFVDSY